MEYRRLGRSGLKVSALSLGSMNFGGPTDAAESGRIVEAAAETGVNLIDCADGYQNGESLRLVGEVLAARGLRDKFILTSKVFLPTGTGPNDRGHTRCHVIESCESALRKLKTDRLDILFLHRFDPDVEFEEVLYTLELLVRSGKVLHTACSTFPPWRTVEAIMTQRARGWSPFVAEQPPYNLVDRRAENEILPMAAAFDLGILAWSPLAQGVLAGRYDLASGFDPGSRASQKAVFAQRVTPAAIDVARRLGVYLKVDRPELAVAAFSVAWLVARPGVTSAILGPRTLAQFRDLLAAAEVRPTPEDEAFCDGLVPPGQFVSNHFNTSRWMK